MGNELFYGDNLDVMRESIASESVDLVYLDPPFNSQVTYNLLFRSQSGNHSKAQIEAFEDSWRWGHDTELAFEQVVRSGHTLAADLLRAMRSFLGDNDMMAYLAMMSVRLIELRRVLKKTGSLYLHCDPTASHYLKIVLDGIFGAEQFRNEIIWQRSKNPKGSQHKSVRWGPSTDTILFYAKSSHNTLNVDAAKSTASDADLARRFPRSDELGRWADGPILRSGSMGARPNLVYEHKGFTPGPAGWRMKASELAAVDEAGDLYWTEEGNPRRKLRPGSSELNPLSSCWTDISPLNSQAQERLGYPTQKPVDLLERILKASSKPGDVILDPFCGCGTAVHAAQRLGRNWIGIDITHLAISLIERRLKDSFPGIDYVVHGTPKDIEGAHHLAQKDKYQFQWWALSLVEAQPFAGKKKGADGGIDGLIYFRSSSRVTERAIVSVKGGENVSVPMIRDLKGVLDRERAPIGVFLTLAPPTRPMEKEAVAAGFYSLGGRQYPRIQPITVEEALNGRQPAIPLVDVSVAFRRAPREPAAMQHRLI